MAKNYPKLTKQQMYIMMYAKEMIYMLSTNITNFRKNIFSLLEQTIKFNEPISITTKDGNAMVISEEDYNGLIETMYLSSLPDIKEQIVDGLRTPLSGCIPESEVQW